MEYQDHYTILDVDINADATEIQQAFRKLAQKYHPDKTGGDKKAEALFKLINEAYEVLSDANKRAKYDQQRTKEPRPDEAPSGNNGADDRPVSGKRRRDDEDKSLRPQF